MKKIGLLALTTAILMLTASTSWSQDDGDWQLWNIVSAEKDLSDDVKLTLEEETRWGDDMNSFIYQSLDAGLIFHLNSWLDLGPNFRYVIQDDAGSWEHEARPYITAILHRSWPNLELSNRSRLEHRYLTRTKDTERYRNMTEIKIPLSWTKLAISPFIREELFFKFDQDDYNENRLSGGIAFKLFNAVNGEIFYLWRRTKSLGEWKEINVLGIQTGFVF